MYQINKYSNGRFYDTVNKAYVKRNDIEELIQSGEKVTIVATKTGADLTEEFLKEMENKAGKKQSNESKEHSKTEDDSQSTILTQFFQKGGHLLFDYAKKSVTLWQSFVTMAEDETDKIIRMMIKDKKISGDEGKKLKEELQGLSSDFKNWLREKIDSRVDHVLGIMNLANKNDINQLMEKIEQISLKVESLENSREANEQPLEETIKIKKDTSSPGIPEK